VQKKVGRTRNVPKMYQGVLFPILELNLSDKYPTVGVANPSASYPAKAAYLGNRNLRGCFLVYFDNLFQEKEKIGKPGCGTEIIVYMSERVSPKVYLFKSVSSHFRNIISIRIRITSQLRLI